MVDADLDAPVAFPRRVGREAQHVDADARGSSTPHANSDGGGAGQIEDAATDERAAIRDGDYDGLAGGEICNSDDGTQGQSAMRGRHGVLVVDLAVGAAGVMVGSAVPTGDADLAGFGFLPALRRQLRRRRRRGVGLLFRWRRRRGSLDFSMTAPRCKQANSEQSGEKGCGAHPSLVLAGEVHDTHFPFSCCAGISFLQFYLKTRTG